MWSRFIVSLVGACCIGLAPSCARSPNGPFAELAPSPQGRGMAGVPGAELPDPARGGRVSLRSMLAYAEQNAPELHLAESRLERARAERAAASVLLPENPVVEIGAGPRWNAGGNGFDYEASIEQTFEVAGERGLRIDAAERAGAVTLAEISEVRWRVHLRVHDAFHRTLVARARVSAAQRLLGFAERVMEVARERLRAGDISRLQLQVVEGELAITRQQLLAAEGDYRAARLALAEASGWPVEHPPEPAGTLDAPRQPPELEGLVEAALLRHPGLRTRAAAIAEAEARTRLADREAWPRMTLGLSVAREAEPGATEAGAHVGLLTFAFPLPLWQRNRGPRARARADLAVARAEHRAVQSGVRVRVARAAAMVGSAAQRIEVYGVDVMPKFEESLALLQRGLELGEMDLMEVMVARGRFLELQREALDAYEDYYRAVAALEAEIGEEIWPDERHVDPFPASAETSSAAAEDQP